MKKSIISKVILLSLLMSGCNFNSQSNDSSTSTNNDVDSSTSLSSTSFSSTSSKDNNKTYKVTFKDGEKIIYETEGKTGDFVDIPDDLVSNDSHIEFKGWEGIDENDYEVGKIEIFEEDLVFYAIWYERFGTDNVYSATKLHSNSEIVLDGEKDEAYDDTSKISINTIIKGETNTNAEAYLMWDDSFFYAFIDVKDSAVFGRDSNYLGEQYMEHYDGVEMWIDLLHDDSLAAPGYESGWGGVYRGEPGPMCEAHYKISAGFTPTLENRFGEGSEACWDGWWSNASNNDGVSAGYSKITETGYTVEYKISAIDEHIPDYLRLKENEQIGVGIKIFDKREKDLDSDDRTVEAPCIIAIEQINGDMNGPKKLSNVNLITNTNETK